MSHFGGPAWTLDESTGQYYCHLFLPEQPDLNWENERVREEFDGILGFWCELGVDGFRIDVAHGLGKDPRFRSNPQVRQIRNPRDPRDVFTAFEQRHDLDQDHTKEIFERWNRVVAPYGALLVGETGPDDPKRLARYVGDQTALHSAFYLTPVWLDWDPVTLLGKLRAVHSESPHISWVINNHDNSRSVTRYGGGDRGRFRSLAVTTFQFALGGVPFLFQGEELGLEDGAIEPADFEDPIATRNTLTEEAGHDVWGGVYGRDGCRTAMPWDDGHQNGFTAAARAWLRAAPREIDETVTGQRDVPGSFLMRHRELLGVRKTLPALWTEQVQWIETGTDEAAAVRRGNALTVANLGTSELHLALPHGEWVMAYSSRDRVPIEGLTAAVPPETALFLRETSDA